MSQLPVHALFTPGIAYLIGSLVPLFERQFDLDLHRIVVALNSKPLLRVALVCKAWNRVMTTILWHTYDIGLMQDKVPLDVLGRKLHLVRHLLLPNKQRIEPAEYVVLAEILRNHGHLICLETRNTVFPFHNLTLPLLTDTHSLAELKLIGGGTRMDPPLLEFVEGLRGLRWLELSRFVFTPMDWKQVVARKPKLRKLAILDNCTFRREGTEESNNEDTDGSDNKVTDRNKDDVDSGETEKDEGVVPITHLVLSNRKHSIDFFKAILQASPNLRHLEIQSPDTHNFQAMPTLVRQCCCRIKRVTLKSSNQSWMQGMLDATSHALKPADLLIQFQRFKTPIVVALRERQGALTTLKLDLSPSPQDNGRLRTVSMVLRELSGLQEFTLHCHATEDRFREMVMRYNWNVDQLRTLRLYGIGQRTDDGSTGIDGESQVPAVIPDRWRCVYNDGEYGCCPRAALRLTFFGQDCPLFDVALLDHVKDLPRLESVTITGAKYIKRLL
ncbi:hypothetical protein BGX29_008056 [Mortierella sp. GBA35]|nr:hypothetical protein BGX29_008056 [Mortierella sp. GBA35]